MTWIRARDVYNFDKHLLLICSDPTTIYFIFSPISKIDITFIRQRTSKEVLNILLVRLIDMSLANLVPHLMQSANEVLRVFIM